MKVALLSPVPARADQLPESGVAAYTASLVSAFSEEVVVTVLGQASATYESLGKSVLRPTWTPDRRLYYQVRRAVKQLAPDVLHVQHEFNLYGGLLQGGLLMAALIRMRRRRLPIVVTVHGVVDPSEISTAFLKRNGLPGSPSLVRAGFMAAYRGLAMAADLLVVHHDHFLGILRDAYGISPAKLLTIKPGAVVPRDRQSGPRRRMEILTLGFLTGYKLPEVVVEVAESNALPGVKFRFCVGRNPRIHDRSYEDRYSILERRVRALGTRAEWSGYIPDNDMAAALSRAAVLVLPYTECVSVSAVAAAALRFQTRICYSRALEPLFGRSPLEFELNSSSLTPALEAAIAGSTYEPPSQFTSWTEMARATEMAWRRVMSR